MARMAAVRRKEMFLKKKIKGRGKVLLDYLLLFLKPKDATKER